MAEPARLDAVEAWTTHPNMWTRRAALVATLPWTKQNHPQAPRNSPSATASWAGPQPMCADRDWFIQKAVAWWVRDLSRHDPDRARAFLAAHGAGLQVLRPQRGRTATSLINTDEHAAYIPKMR